MAPLRAHPVKGGARVEAAGERDADVLTRRHALQNVRHVLSETTIILARRGLTAARGDAASGRIALGVTSS